MEMTDESLKKGLNYIYANLDKQEKRGVVSKQRYAKLKGSVIPVDDYSLLKVCFVWFFIFCLYQLDCFTPYRLAI